MIDIPFDGDCTDSTTYETEIEFSIQTRLSSYSINIWISIEIECGSIVTRVVLPETVPAGTALGFAESVNNTAITVPGTNLSSIPGSVRFSNAPSSSGTEGDDSSTGIIAGAVVAVIVVIILVLVVVRQKRNKDRDNRRESTEDPTVVNNVAVYQA